MTPERHRQIGELYRAVLELPLERRSACLDEVCGNDKALREDIDSLLAQQSAGDAWIDRPALEMAARALASTPSACWIGRQVHHYQVLSLLGAGGMGEVYRAHDTRLDRDVAIKVLPVAYSMNSEWLRRFDLEARAAGQLNHPNVLTVYDVGVHEGAPYIVAELLEGKELRELLRQKFIPARRAIDYARQIAGGLSAAHAKGIVHRDLKPENIFITTDGRVKILDFGLATLKKSTSGGHADPDNPNGPPKSQRGLVMGTVGYMSPEQARGDEADHRSDIFVLGVILHEMLRGRTPFEGESAIEVLNGILRTELPDSMETDLKITPVLGRVLRRCLEKKPEQRFQSAVDLGFALETLSLPSMPAEEHTQPAALSRPTPYRRLIAVVAAAVAGMLVFAAAAAWLPGSAEDTWRQLFAKAVFNRLTDFGGGEWGAQISRDGGFVTFISGQDGPADAWVSQIGSGLFYNRTRGEAPELGNPRVRNLRFSPDGSTIALWVRPQGRIHTWAASTLGGPIRPYMPGAIEPDWSPDGTRVVHHTDDPGDPIFVTEPGEAPRQIFKAEPGIHCHFPVWSPDGRFIYFVKGFPPDEMDIWRIPSTGGSPEQITSHNSLVAYPTFLDARMLLYVAKAADGSGPWLYGTDVERHVSVRINNFGLEQYTSISASADGRRLVATVANPVASLWRIPISDSAIDESGAKLLQLPTTQALSPRLGPDYLLYLSAKGAVWKQQLRDGTTTELWSGSSFGRVLTGPAISPDGARIAFPAQKGGRTKLHLMNADGTGVRTLGDSLEVRGALGWSPDGKWITIATGPASEARVVNFPADGGAPVPLVKEYSIDPVWSPDRRFLVYSGREEGVTFRLKAATDDGKPYNLPELILSRGASRFSFVPGKASSLIVLKGEIKHKNFWLIDLATGAERPLTRFGPEFVINDFDVSSDGREIVFSRQKENSNVIVIDLPH